MACIFSIIIINIYIVASKILKQFPVHITIHSPHNNVHIRFITEFQLLLKTSVTPLMAEWGSVINTVAFHTSTEACQLPRLLLAVFLVPKLAPTQFSIKTKMQLLGRLDSNRQHVMESVVLTVCFTLQTCTEIIIRKCVCLVSYILT